MKRTRIIEYFEKEEYYIFVWWVKDNVGGISTIAKNLKLYRNIQLLEKDEVVSKNPVQIINILSKYEATNVVLNGVSVTSLIWSGICFLLNINVIIIEHNQSAKLGERRVLRVLINTLCKKHLFVDEYSYIHSMKSLKNVELINPYIKAINSSYQLNKKAKLRLKSDNIRFGVSCYKFVEKDGVDFYGIEQTYEIARSISEDIEVIVISPDINKIKERYPYLTRDSNVYLEGNETNLHSWYKVFDVFFRIPVSDGFGLSIYEALDAGCLVVCSDVTSRPQTSNVILVNRLDNIESVARKIEEAVNA